VRLDHAFDYPKDWRECLKLVGDDKHGFHDPLLYATQRLAKELYRTYGPDFDDLLAPCLAQFDAAIDAATRGDRPQSYIDQCKHDLARMVHGAIAQFEANKHRKAGERAPIEPQYPDTALPFEEANAETRNGIAYWFEECAKAHEMDRLQREAKQAWIDKGCPEPDQLCVGIGEIGAKRTKQHGVPVHVLRRHLAAHDLGCRCQSRHVRDIYARAAAARRFEYVSCTLIRRQPRTGRRGCQSLQSTASRTRCVCA
jgi:hypothetical protein